MLAYVVWTSLFAVPPLFALSWLFEGWPRSATGLDRCAPRRLGGRDLAGGRQRHVRLCRLGLAAVALRRRDRRADVAAGPGLRHGRRRRSGSASPCRAGSSWRPASCCPACASTSSGRDSRRSAPQAPAIVLRGGASTALLAVDRAQRLLDGRQLADEAAAAGRRSQPRSPRPNRAIRRARAASRCAAAA